MKSGTMMDDKQDSTRCANGIKQLLLRSEISFWKDLIAGCGPAHCVESLERMQQALALAESRLTMQIRDYQHENVAHGIDKLPSNVYPIPRNIVSRLPKPK